MKKWVRRKDWRTRKFVIASVSGIKETDDSKIHDMHKTTQVIQSEKEESTYQEDRRTWG